MARHEDPPPHRARGAQEDGRELIERTGAVVIGRNEGARLVRSLSSLAGRVSPIVYVDSGSTDGSPLAASALGAEVVALDMSIPFTAARARNAGFARLLQLAPDTELVQLVDGDCEVVPGWVEAAAAALRARPELGVVCGRRRERNPSASIYNRLCDLEWDTPVGPADACGGDAMMRASAFRAAGGFDPTLIAGEEPELCLRIRRAGFAIERLDREMTLHDAGMTRFSEWWKRSVRAGHAFAEGAHLHGDAPERHWVRESRRVWVFGAFIPLAAVLGALPTLGASLWLLSGYPISALRSYRSVRRRSPPRTREEALLWACFTTIAKFPELVGALRFHWGRTIGERSGLIEYKRSP